MTAPRTRSILAWHWLAADRRLGFDDGRLVEPGQTLTVDGEPELCKNGLHASRSILDALGYAPGPIICRVRLSGRIVEGDDKLVGTERRCLWMVDATTILRKWAIWCAERALDRVGVRVNLVDSDLRALSAVRDVLDCARRYLTGDATESTLIAAWGAAWDAVRDAAWDAAWDAAKGAAWSAAWSAAGGAVWDAVRDAAWGAAWDAARDAAWRASGGAAWGAERMAQARELTRLVMAEHKRQRVRP
jgi:hypothetical protein